ncbi:MAG: hypothetical protein KDE47_04395 [Caldilineaceae bacterium]|nr:hypothetical protein [Caldilineaceae bacterium]
MTQYDNRVQQSDRTRNAYTTDTTNEESNLELILKGAIAGLAGTAALTVGMSLMPHLLPQRSHIDPQRDQPDEPNVRLVEEAMMALWGTLPSDRTKAVGGQFAHWGYGATWGAIYALAQDRLRLPPNTHGLLLGLLVGTTASTVVPALDHAPPPTREPFSQTLAMTGLQLLFGWVTARTFDGLWSSHHATRRSQNGGRRAALRYQPDPYATQRYPGRPDGRVIEERFEQVDAPMPANAPSFAEPRIRTPVYQ